MGQITSGVGLISGFPTADIIDQLIAIDARPKQLIEQRNAILQSQQVAFQEVSARLLGLKLSVTSFRTNSTFDTTAAISSNESVLTATSTTSATPGVYNFLVDRLVSTQQMVSAGFVDKDVTAIGAGTLTFEFGDARLDSNTDLLALNGGSGVQRGRIRITDRSVASADIDLSRALTVNEVLEAINSTSGISVTATVDNDRLVLTDTSGSTTTNLAVIDIGSTNTTADLGLDVAAVGDVLTGDLINQIGSATSLSILNDGQGVEIQTTPNHVRIQRRNAALVDVDLTGATTIGDVIDAINAQSASGVTAEIDATGVGIKLTDAGPDLGSTFEVTALNGSTAAVDLGILGIDGNADGIIDGERVLSTINSKLIKNLNGGSGANLGTVSITNRLGSSTSVDLSSAASITQITDLINASGSNVLAALNQAGNGITLTDQTGSTISDLIMADVSGSAAVDLNLAGIYTADFVDSGNLQFSYISERTTLASFNGGQGISRGRFTVTDSAGAQSTVDLSQGNEVTVQDVLDEINSKGLQVNARVNDNGDGILIEDTGPGIVKLTIEEDGSSTATDLGIRGEATNVGDDIDGTFEKTISVSATDTLDDVVSAINASGIRVAATVINDGSQTKPYRLNLTARDAGKAGRFVLDDGALDLSAISLTEGQNGVVFFGSSDPVKGIAITTSGNSLSSVIPGATIDLKNTSDSAVKVAITRDNTAIVSAVESLVSDFNSTVDTLNRHDSYDPETEERGLLLGDATVSLVRGALFRLANGSNSELSSQFNTLAQLGITIGSGAKMVFDSSKFDAALEADRDAVKALFTTRETETDSDGNVSITLGGIGARFEEMLDRLTDSSLGTLQFRVNSIQDQIDLGASRIEQIDVSLASRRGRLEAQFLAMERALAQLQSQSTALGSLQALVPSVLPGR